MALWFHSTIHSTIVATSLVAVVAVGLASSAIITSARDAGDLKADRLPVVADGSGYLTIETRGDGISVLKRITVD